MLILTVVIIFLSSLFLLNILSTRTVFAQIPLFYQLLEAYHPTNNLTEIIVTPSPTPTLPAKALAAAGPLVLGVSTQTPPLRIGGEGQVVTIAVLGDSMIDTLQKDLPQLQTALQSYYPTIKFNLLNYGVGGDNIEAAIKRLTTDYDYLGTNHPSLVSQNPDLVVVESFAYNNFGNSQTGIDRHWTALSNLLAILKQQLPQTKIVLAATIAPNSVIFGNGIKDVHFSALEKIEKTSTIKLYLQNLVNFATSQNYPLADAYHLSLQNGEGTRTFISAADGLHPSGPGGQFFANVVAKTIYDHRLINSP